MLDNLLGSYGLHRTVEFDKRGASEFFDLMIFIIFVIILKSPYKVAYRFSVIVIVARSITWKGYRLYNYIESVNWNSLSLLSGNEVGATKPTSINNFNPKLIVNNYRKRYTLEISTAKKSIC